MNDDPLGIKTGLIGLLIMIPVVVIIALVRGDAPSFVFWVLGVVFLAMLVLAAVVFRHRRS